MKDLLAWLTSHKWQLFPSIVAVVALTLMIFVTYTGPANIVAVCGWLALFAAIIVIIAAIVHSIKEPDRTGEEPMPRWKRTFLMAYLMVVGAVLVLMLLSLSSLDFPETPVVPQAAAVATPTPPPTPTPNLTPTAPARRPATPAPATAGRPGTPAPTATPIVPIVARVFPQAVGGSPPTQYLTIYGRNFQDKSEVRFDSSPVMSKLLANDLLLAQLRAEDVVGKGSIMVDVKNPDGAVSNAISVPIDKPKVVLNLLFFWRFWHPLITREMQLLLLVICAGALGSYLHAVMSIADFIGSRKLKVSWFWWYLTRPFLGMAMGLVFYSMLRGGFLVGTPADEKFVNPFGVIAIGVLVGMFADRAAQKLSEIFRVVFQSAEPRPDKLDETVPVISKLEPNKVKAGSPDTLVTITGEHLSSVKTVKINEDARTAATTNDKEMTVMLNAKDIEKPSSIQITVVDADGDVSAAATFEVTNDTEDESEEAVG